MAQDCYKQDLKQKKHMCRQHFLVGLGEPLYFISSHDKIPTLKFIIIVKLLLHVHEHFFEATTNLSADAPDSKFCEFEISHIIVITA